MHKKQRGSLNLEGDGAGGEVSKGYSEYLSSKPWDAIVTVTFRKPRKDAIYNRKQVWGELASYSDRGFLVSEPHTTGFLHYHGLVLFRSWGLGNDKQRICEMMENSLTNKFGWSDVSRIRGMQEVAGYCSKYVSKAIDDVVVDYDFMGDWSK